MSEQPSRGGARRAQPATRAPRPRVRAGSGLAALAVVAVAALLVAVTPEDAGPPDVPLSATGAPVQDAMLGCPRVERTPTGVKTAYGVGLAPLPGAGATGTITTEPGGPLTLARGQARPVKSRSQDGLGVVAEGDTAQGLVAWRADTGSSIAVADCAAPRASWWFTGAGAALDHESTVTLANLDTGPAVVDVRVLSPDGEVDVSETGGKGISVAPGASVTLSLVELSPQSDELAVWVHATRGRVVAAVSDRFATRPGARPGYEWMPAQTEPSRVVRLSGVPSVAVRRTLLVANPSALESLVRIELAGPNGRFVPAGLAEVTVGPGEVASVDLTRSLAGDAFAVRVRGSRPVVAAMRSVQGSGDLAYAGPSKLLRDSAALPVVGATTVEVTAVGAVSRVTLTAYSAAGRPVGETRLTLAARSTSAWPVPAGAAYVLAEPTQGKVFGSLVYGAPRAGVAAVPLRDLPTSIRVPAVRPGG